MIKDIPFFSIVVPIYNAEKYLGELIKSIKKQTYSDWELILVDDGSTDNSLEVCKKFISDNISIYHTNNNGMTMAVYHGILNSKGKYIIVADADDRLLSRCLEVVKRVIEANNCEMVVYGFRTFGDDSYECRLPLKPNRIYGREEIVEAIIEDTYFALWNKVFLGDIMRKNCTCNLGKISMNNDIAMIFPFIRNINACYVLSDILYEYRLYRTSVSHNITYEKVIDAGRTIGFAEEVLVEAGIYNRKIENLLYNLYADQITHMFYLVSRGENVLSDFDSIRDQRVYQKLRILEKMGKIGFKKLVLLRLYRMRKYRTIEIILKFKKVKNIYELMSKIGGVNRTIVDLNRYIVKKRSYGWKGLYYRIRRDKLAKKYGVEIGVQAKIDGPIDFPHPHGIVIGEGVRIGKNLKIFHNVTIGQKNGEYPIIGDNVTIFPGSVIVGNVHIGNNVIIGANSFVNMDIEDGNTVAGNPAKVIKKNKL